MGLAPHSALDPRERPMLVSAAKAAFGPVPPRRSCRCDKWRRLAFHTYAASQAVFLAPTPNGHGYWMADSAGDVFSFGDAQFHGSIPEAPTSINSVSGLAPQSSPIEPWLCRSFATATASTDCQWPSEYPEFSGGYRCNVTPSVLAARMRSAICGSCRANSSSVGRLEESMERMLPPIAFTELSLREWNCMQQ